MEFKTGDIITSFPNGITYIVLQATPETYYLSNYVGAKLHKIKSEEDFSRFATKEEIADLFRILRRNKVDYIDADGYGYPFPDDEIDEYLFKRKYSREHPEPEINKSIWIARDCDGRLYVHTSKPELSEHPKLAKIGYWQSEGDTRKLDRKLYPFIKENQCIEFVAK